MNTPIPDNVRAALAAMKPLNAGQVAQVAALAVTLAEALRDTSRALGPGAEREAQFLAIAESLEVVAAVVANLLPDVQFSQVIDLPLIEFVEIVGQVLRRVIEVNGPVLQAGLIPAVMKVAEQVKAAATTAKQAASQAP
jgi:hypothetical protein